MLIEFKIKVDGVSGETPPVSADLPAHGQLPQTYVPAAVANAQQGTASPAVPPGSGTVFVIGPIVICGSASTAAGPAVSAPDQTGQAGKGKGKGNGKKPGGSGPQSSTDT